MTTMQAQDIKDVLLVRDIIANADGTADLIANLIAWRDGFTSSVPATPEPVAVQQDHSVAEDAAATAEAKTPTPAKAPAKAAPKAKGRAKPPPPADDDGPSPDPSDDDF